MAKKFFRTIVRVVVLTEDAPLGSGDYEDMDTDLADIAHLIDSGPAVGTVDIQKVDILTEKQMAKALIKAGSEPGFFNLPEEGDHWSDKEALEVYKMVTGDDPWDAERREDTRREIADEMRKIALAKTIKEAISVIEWWSQEKEDLEPIVKKVRQAYKEWRMKHG